MMTTKIELQQLNKNMNFTLCQVMMQATLPQIELNDVW